MSDADNLEKTMPTPPKRKRAAADTAETQRVENPPSEAPQMEAKPRPKRGRWVLAAIGSFLLLLFLGAFAGYQTAVSARQAEARLQSAVEANYQYQLGLIDLQNGACDRARERFIYVIGLIPEYPQVQEQLVQASLCAGTTPSPILDAQATVGPSPTPDPRGADQIFADAQGLLAARNWDALLPSLDTLRKNFPDFQPIEVDRLYYIGLRNRGADRIVAGDLERGIFDLNRAEQIGPIDVEAQNYRQWAVWYIVGASFWEVDWTQSVQYFQLVAAAAPSLHDLNFFTAQDRLVEAYVGYAGELIRQADDLARDKQWCSAQAKMDESNGYSPLSPEDQDNYNFYAEKCTLNGDEPR